MLHQLSGFEFSNLTLLVGVLVATFVSRVTGSKPGGILVTPFFILAAVSSIWWALCLPAMGIIISLTYKRFFSSIFLGRQPVFIMAAMSVVSMTLIGTIMQHYYLIPPSDFNYPLGIVMPAILGFTISKQGVKETFKYMALATVISIVIIAAIYMAGLALGHDFHGLDRLIAQHEILHLGWSAVLSLISIAIGFVIYKARAVKSVGYIMLPFLATLCVVSPRNFALVMGLSAITYAVTALFRKYSLMIGIGRYAFVLVFAITLVWTIEYVLLRTTPNFSPFMGTSIFAVLAITVMVNEQAIYGVRKAVPMLALSLTLMVGIELAGAYTVQTLSHQNATIRSLTVSGHPANIKQELGGR
jgi:hypothetical protein